MSEDSSKKRQQKFSIRDSQIEDTQIVSQDGENISIQNKCSGDNNINNLTIIASQPPRKRQEYRFRRGLLNQVKKVWIESVLKRSLHKQISIIIDLEERSDSIAKPCNREIISSPNTEVRPLARNTKIIDIFEDLDIGQRQLLILGEPGTGKTIALLELTRDWIERAKNDDSLLIPVVFNLSSWKDKKIFWTKKKLKNKRNKIIDWLVEELNSYYKITRKDALNLIKFKKLLFLFDGLDEVEEKYRDECVTALNDFIETDSEIVICSRIKDYQALSQRLKLEKAIYLKPLRFEQIDRYLDSLGNKLIGLKTLLRKELKLNLKSKILVSYLYSESLSQNTWFLRILSKDSPLNDLAKTPLMLYIMIFVYEGLSIQNSPKTYWLEEKKKQLFDDYIRKMFARRLKIKPPYSPEQLISFLIFLSKGMKKESQSIFLMEQIQPSYLNKKELVLYRIFLGISLFAIGFLTVFYCIQMSALMAVFLGMCGFLLGIGKKRIQPIVKFKWNFKQVLNIFGLPILLFFLLFFFFGFLLGLIAQVNLIISLIIGLLVGAHIVCFIIGSSSLLFNGILDKNSQENFKNTTKLNEEIWKSATNTWIIILASTIWTISLLIILILFRVREFDTTWLSAGIFAGFGFGVLLAIFNGSALAVIQHLLLRSIVWFKHKINWNYQGILDYATERIFMQKVGGGYIFIHKMLLEHFAQIDLDNYDRLINNNHDRN